MSRGARAFALLFSIGGASLGWANAALAQEEPEAEEVLEEPAIAELPQVDQPSINAALDELLNPDAYAFCRRARYDLKPEEEPLCALAQASTERCPSFEAACERLHAVDPEPRAKPSALWPLILAILRGLGYVLLAVIVVVAVGFSAFLLAQFLRSRRRSELRSAPPSEAGARAAEPTAQPEFNRDAELHLERARRLAERGDYVSAFFELHLGVVLSLDARGFIDARRGRSNGDYARDLLAKPELRSAFRDVARATEAVQFGGRTPTRESFEQLLARASSLLGTAISLIAILSLCIACEPSESAARRGSERCGTRADGYSLFCQLLEKQWLAAPVRLRYRPLDQIGEDVATLILLADRLDAAQTAALDAWVAGGGVAMLAAPVEHFDSLLGVKRSGPPCDKATAEGRTLHVMGPSFADSQLSPQITCTSGQTFIGHAPWGDGQLFFLPGPELLQNASLVAGENAWALTPLFLPLQGPVEIVGRWTGSAADNPLSTVHAAGLSPWLLQLVLLALAHALFRGAPFGRRVDPPRNARRRFSEHVRALGERWADARAARTALIAYSSYALDVLRERTPSGAKLSISELAHALAKRTGRSEDEVARTLAWARLAREDTEAPINEPEHLDTLKKLGRLLEESGGSR